LLFFKRYKGKDVRRWGQEEGKHQKGRRGSRSDANSEGMMRRKSEKDGDEGGKEERRKERRGKGE